MRKRIKRVVKKIWKTGKWLLVFGLVLVIGIAIGAESSTTHESVIIYNESGGEFNEEHVLTIERHFENAHLVDEIVIPPIPEIPEIPAVPAIPEMPTTIYVDNSPSFFDIVDGISTVLASLVLIGLGVYIIRRDRPGKEKSPESLAN